MATWQRGPGTVPDSHYRWTGYFLRNGPDALGPAADHSACDPS
ncbi:hypothetical protein [Streptomyces violaceusniger]